MGSIRKVTKVVKGKEYTYYEARYTEGFDPGTGKQIQRSITDKSKKVVAQKLKAAMAALDAGTYKAPCKMTVAQFTLDVYGHVTQKMRQESANRMQKFYEQLNSENGL